MSRNPNPHSVLARICEQITPPLNPHIMRGLASVYQKDFVNYLDTICKRLFDNCVPGMVYMGHERCTPEEEYRERTRPRGNRRIYDFARSSIFSVKIQLGIRNQHGEIVPFKVKYLDIPYIEDGGLMRLSGTLYHVKPVLTNKVISPGNKLLFVRMLGTRKNFFRTSHSIKVDGETRVTFVVHAAIHETRVKSPRAAGLTVATTKAKSCMVHYLLLRYGFTEAFRKYLGHVPVVGYAEEITPEKYPPSDWVIVSTAYTSTKPSGYTEALYESSKIRMAVRRDQWNSVTMSFVSEVFYVIDHFPAQITPKTMDNRNNWILLMGYILIGGQYTTSRIFGQMYEHMETLEDYVDEFAADKLSEKGYEVRDFYDLAALLTSRFPDLLTENDRLGNVYEKYYDVTYHVMRPITYALTRICYMLQKAAKRFLPARDDSGYGALQWAPNDAMIASLEAVLVRKLKPGAVFHLASDKNVVETVTYCADHWYPKITSKVSEQEKGSGGRRVMTDADHLDISQIECGSLLFLAKADPTPVGNINPYMNIDLQTGSPIPNPELKAILDETKKLLDDK